MQVRYYGLFDSCAKEYIRTFTSKNDDTAQRAAEYIVREPNFDRIAGRDYVINYLYTFESDSGLIVDNSIHVICSLGQSLAAFEAEENQKKALAALEQLNEKEKKKNGKASK